MSLVAYEFSDSEEANSDLELSEPVSQIVENIEANDSERDFERISNASVLFSSLPLPKIRMLSAVEEVNDEFLRKNASIEITNKLKKKPSVKITVPTLIDYNSDEEDLPKKKFKPCQQMKVTGLFAMLPPPKAVKQEVIKFIPKSVKVKKPAKDTEQTTDIANVSEDEGDSEKNINYFSSIFTERDKCAEQKPGPNLGKPTTNTLLDGVQPIISEKSNHYFSELATSCDPQLDVTSQQCPEADPHLDETAYRKLCGRRGHRHKATDGNIIDISADQIMPSSRDWMTNALMSQEQPTASTVRKGDEPSLQHRRKHQITYLAYQAKVNEQDLKNQWALNRMSRKQTQAKYGF